VRPTTQSIRYSMPYTLGAALAACGPGREDYIRRIYALVEAADGVVWDCEPEYGGIDLGIELPGGETHPAWQELHTLWEAAEASCEVCGVAGVFRHDRTYWRVLCDVHA